MSNIETANNAMRKMNLLLDIAVAKRLIKIEDEKRRESGSPISELDLQHRIFVNGNSSSIGSIMVLHK